LVKEKKGKKPKKEKKKQKEKLNAPYRKREERKSREKRRGEEQAAGRRGKGKVNNAFYPREKKVCVLCKKKGKTKKERKEKKSREQKNPSIQGGEKEKVIPVRAGGRKGGKKKESFQAARKGEGGISIGWKREKEGEPVGEGQE